MKKWKECGVVDGQVCGKKSPKAQGERWRACKSGVQGRAPKGLGEYRSPRRSVRRSGRARKRAHRRPRESATGLERAPEAKGGCRRFRKNGGQERAETQGKPRGKRECKLRAIARVSWSRGKSKSGRVGRMKMG